MKKLNDQTTIEIYNQICEYYLKLAGFLIPELELMGNKIETEKQEKEFLRADLRKRKVCGKHSGSFTVRLNPELLKAMERAGIPDQKIYISQGTFWAGFTTIGLFEVKTQFEKLITRKHHRFYTTEKQKSQAA